MTVIDESDQCLESKQSLFILSDNLVNSTKKIIASAKTEEELRIGFERNLNPLLESIGIKTMPHYERLSEEAKTIYSGRPDAVHGEIIIEYEPPGAFNSKSAVLHAQNQLISYMKAEYQAFKADPIGRINRLVGVGFDGNKIFFIRYLPKKGQAIPSIENLEFELIGPYPFNQDSARTFLMHLRSLARLPLTAQNLSEKFGPRQEIA